MGDVLILAVFLGVPAALVAVLARSARRGDLRWYRIGAAAALGLALVGGFLTVVSALVHDPADARTDWIGGSAVVGSLVLQAVAVVLAVTGIVRGLRSPSGTDGWRHLVTAVALGTIAVVGIVTALAWDTTG